MMPAFISAPDPLLFLYAGWFGVITEFEGIIVDSTQQVHAQAWLQVAQEMNLPRPLGQTLNRIQGARDEAVSVSRSLYHSETAPLKLPYLRNL
jgi:beta-phosphoglucomutase-like phosphatase (HAD superfamily)